MANGNANRRRQCKDILTHPTVEFSALSHWNSDLSRRKREGFSQGIDIVMIFRELFSCTPRSLSFALPFKERCANTGYSSSSSLSSSDPTPSVPQPQKHKLPASPHDDARENTPPSSPSPHPSPVYSTENNPPPVSSPASPYYPAAPPRKPYTSSPAPPVPSPSPVRPAQNSASCFHSPCCRPRPADSHSHRHSSRAPIQRRQRPSRRWSAARSLRSIRLRPARGSRRRCRTGSSSWVRTRL